MSLPETPSNLNVARQALRDAGFRPKQWKYCRGGIWVGTVWQIAKTSGWIPRLWIIPQSETNSLIVPGFAKKSLWIWHYGVILRRNYAKDLRRDLAPKLKSMRNNLWLLSQMPVPEGAGEQIGRAIETLLVPRPKGEVSRYGRIWQEREPAEYRGMTLLEYFEEVIDAEYRRRIRLNVPLETIARAITRYYMWYSRQWQAPQYLVETALADTQRLWLHEKRPPRVKCGRKKKSLISAETIAKLKAAKAARRKEAKERDEKKRLAKIAQKSANSGGN